LGNINFGVCKKFSGGFHRGPFFGFLNGRGLFPPVSKFGGFGELLGGFPFNILGPKEIAPRRLFEFFPRFGQGLYWEFAPPSRFKGLLGDAKERVNFAKFLDGRLKSSNSRLLYRYCINLIWN